MFTVNQFGQPIGVLLPGWKTCETPSVAPMRGQFCSVEKLDLSKHTEALFSAYTTGVDESDWTYLSCGPFSDASSLQQWLIQMVEDESLSCFAILDAMTNQAVGTASYLRIQPEIGSVEIGYVHFSPLLQRTRLATEAMYLMMMRVFEEHGYRRYEWKCDALNTRSRRAAERLGFSLEGVFRQAVIYKGRNRDTAWFSMIDGEWPLCKAALEAWLDSGNFDESDRQKRSLQQIRRDLSGEVFG